MSYSSYQHDYAFYMSDEGIKKAEAAVRANDVFSHMKECSFAQMLQEMGWTYDGECFDRTDAYTMKDTHEFFKTIAPWVKIDSWIIMIGEDQCIWRYYFDGETCHEQYGEIEFKPNEPAKPEDTTAQDNLLQYMSKISEEHWSAGWLIDLENKLWAEVHGKPQGGWDHEKGYGKNFILSELERENLTRLSILAGGWGHFPDDANEPQFIEAEAWLRMQEESSGK